MARPEQSPIRKGPAPRCSATTSIITRPDWASSIRRIAASAVGFGSVTAFWPGILSSAIAPRWAFIAVAIPSLLWFVPRLWSPAVVWLLLGLTYAGLSLLWSPDQLGGLNVLVHLFLFIGAAIVGVHLVERDQVIMGMAVGVGITVPLVAAQFIGYSDIEQAVPPAGLFLNRNILAELTMPLFLYVLIGRRHVTLIISLGLIMAMSVDRAAIAGLTVAIIIVMGKRYLICSLALVVGILLTVASPWGITSVSGRLMALSEISPDISFWGSGIGSFGVLYPTWGQYLHCDPLQLILELGIGAIPFFMVIGNALICRDYSLVPERAALVCIVSEAMFSMPFQLPASAFLAALLIGGLQSHRLVIWSRRDDSRSAVEARA